MLVGRYVKTFEEATHAIPDGMFMNADYPYKLPRVVRVEAGEIRLEEHGKTVDRKIRRRRGLEIVTLYQESSFERCFGRRPRRFVFRPFRANGFELVRLGP